MLGAVIGDIAGSRYEKENIKSKDFVFIDQSCSMTDDSIMTFAIARAILDCNGDYTDLSRYAVQEMREIGLSFTNCGYSGKFLCWLFSDEPEPYGSYGNGAAMRVSACGFAAKSIEDAKDLAYKVTCVSHDHPEGLKGAEATAVAVFLAKSGYDIEYIGKYIHENYYKMDFALDEIRPTYSFDVSCQGSVPQAIKAFLESTSFEDAIRNAISLGGDSDTIAAIAGGIAEAYYGIPEDIKAEAIEHITPQLLGIAREFEDKFQK
ncbi:MAG: ADP-ribosylglycohydrolase family protein [Clostridia bacterium]|nr:ADP-ribosylglycohydrolase family protein [Clostridia bacterium]